MKKATVSLILVSGLCTGILAQPELEFVKKPQKKSVSAAALKEEIVDELAQMLKAVPELLRAVACVQEQSLTALEQYAQGQKGCFWDTATKQELTVCRDRVCQQARSVAQLTAA